MDNEQITTHTHNGTDSQKLNLTDLNGLPASALTAASGGSLTSGGTEDMKSADTTILNNVITRVGEIEARLQSLGLIN